MPDLIFKPFKEQKQFLRDTHRRKGAFAGKRGGKTEIGAIQAGIYQDHKTAGEWHESEIDPYLGLIIAPTFDMLRRLSLKKFLAYFSDYLKPGATGLNKSTYEMTWHDGSEIYGLSADKPERIEGIKAHWIWLDEVFQMKEQLFLECIARTQDTKGTIFCTGSLGPQFINPKMHWIYEYFKQSPDEDTNCHEWRTIDNPYNDPKELTKLKNKLDPVTYRAMFEISWDTIPKNAVYHEFSDANVQHLTYNPALPTFVSIDWGFAHPAAVGFFQYDYRRDTVYLVDEIVQSKLKIDELFKKIIAKPYEVDTWYCDIAGNQEREQIGKSNIRWFAERGIKFKYRRSMINYGIPIVRSYIKDGKGRARFIINESCKKSIDGMRQYRYPEKDGIILNENPVKKDDDAVDMIRYFFVNHLDKSRKPPSNTVVKFR